MDFAEMSAIIASYKIYMTVGEGMKRGDAVALDEENVKWRNLKIIN
jgi:hypothetical protein